MTSVQELLDAAPPAVGRLLDAAAGGPFDAGAIFADEAIAYVATRDQGLRGEVSRADGAAAAGRVLSGLAPSRIEIEACAADGSEWWAEVTRTAGSEVETCLVGARVDEAGRVTRLLWFGADRVPGAASERQASAADGRAAVERYFGHLMNHRFEQAVSTFAADCIYSHPPYGRGSVRVLFVGSDTLLDGFVNVRGRSPVRQEVQTVLQDGRWAFVEGVVEGIPNGGSFTAAARLDADGLIERYVAFYSAQRLAGRY